MTDPREQHRHRVARALMRRVGPGEDLTAKQLAHLIGCSPQHVSNMMHCRHDPSSWLMGELMRVFGPSFAADVYGPIGVAMWRRDNEALTERQADRAAAAIGDLFDKLTA